MNKITIYDVAAVAGVSLSTVSRVLNNHPKVTNETKQKVLRVIKELNYRPNVIARGLANHKLTTVAVVVSDTTKTLLSRLLVAISDIASQYNYSINLFSTNKTNNITEIINTIITEQTDGILFLDEGLSEDDINIIKQILNQNNIPYAIADRF